MCHADGGDRGRGLTFTPEVTLAHTWIVTKSQPHADSLVIQLRRQGFRAHIHLLPKAVRRVHAFLSVHAIMFHARFR